MEFTPSILTPSEAIAFTLRGLYESYGYDRFKMGKFEEYELYVKNKDFLASDRMITFTDGEGTLLALKPDVTISILKNTQEGEGALRKVYYHESVYRTRPGETAFHEVMQAGLECIGDLDVYSIYEVIALAVRSLGAIDENHMLDLSHMGLISGLLQEAGVLEEQFSRVLSAIREKNPTELRAICDDLGIAQEGRSLLGKLIDTYGKIKVVLDILEPDCKTPEARAALTQLRAIDALLTQNGLGERVQLDFSVVNDMGYYNGIVFRGFIQGLAAGVLSGGQYDKLVAKMGKPFGAIGFAITLNELERLAAPRRAFDADTLFLYDEQTDLESLSRQSAALSEAGMRVLVRKGGAGNIVSRAVMDLRGGAKA